MQAIASEKKYSSGKLFGIFHISAFDLADATADIKKAAQDAKNTIGSANSELTAFLPQLQELLPCMQLPFSHAMCAPSHSLYQWTYPSVAALMNDGWDTQNV